jgi:hypothetical protein
MPQDEEVVGVIVVGVLRLPQKPQGCSLSLGHQLCPLVNYDSAPYCAVGAARTMSFHHLAWVVIQRSKSGVGAR